MRRLRLVPACVLLVSVMAATASTPPQTPARQGLKVLISVDMEGVAGVVTANNSGRPDSNTGASASS